MRQRRRLRNRGRPLETSRVFPMPVILIGAIGGVMRAGIIGLFVGAVVMAVGYKIFTAWMEQAENDHNSQGSDPHP